MHLKQLVLKNFKNYDNLNLKFLEKVNIIHGKNGQGKTNIIESIYYLLNSESFKSITDNEIVKTNKNNFNIKGFFMTSLFPIKYEINYQNEIKVKKIDDSKILNKKEYQNYIKTILFHPDDITILKGTPKERRKYLDNAISLINDNYVKILKDYKKINRIRNDYLKKIQLNQKIDLNYFKIISNYLVKKGSLLIYMRYKYINKINEFSSIIYENLSKLKKFTIKYSSLIEYSDNIDEIEFNFLQKLEELYQQEINVGKTLIGPHLDEIEFLLNNKPMKIYGSQGQQRLSVITLKLSEIEIHNKYQKEYPIILLDDVFGELDNEKRNKFVKYFDNNHQIIITTADLKTIPLKIRKSAKQIKIEDGKILEEVLINGKKRTTL